MRERPTLAGSRLGLPSICDICGNARSTRKHAKCSRIRQQTKQAEWATFMAEQAAKRQAKQERRRYGR
jgi:hypothetical protein